GIVRRRLEMPHALELPRMLRAVVPLMCRQRPAGLGRGVVDEPVALALGHHELAGLGIDARILDPVLARRAGLLPRLAAVVRALDDLAEPARRLRRVESVRVGWRALQVIDLPAGKVGARDLPI